MVLFKDINKLQTDLLHKNFIHDKSWQIEFRHKANNPIFQTDASLKDDKSVLANSVIKYALGNGEIETKTGTTGQIVNLRYKLPIISGLGLNINCTRDTIKNNSCISHTSINMGMDYSKSLTSPHFNFNFNPYLSSWNLSFTKLFKIEKNWDIHCGGELNGNNDLLNAKMGLGLFLTQRKPETFWTMGLKCYSYRDNLLEKIVASVYASSMIPNSPQYGVEVTHTNQLMNTNISFGGLWYLDSASNPALTDLIFKLKLNPEGKIAISLLRKFSEGLTGIFSAQMDGMNKTEDPFKFGVKFCLTA